MGWNVLRSASQAATQEDKASKLAAAIQDKLPVRKAELYQGPNESHVLSIKDVELREILRNNISNLNEADVPYKLDSMTWTMLAQAVAKDVYGATIDDAKAKALAEILQNDNGCDQPVKVLSGKWPLTGGQAIMSLLHFTSPNQYYVYEKLNWTRDGWWKWGAFPKELDINISDKFIKAISQEEPAPAPAPAPVPAPVVVAPEPKPEPKPAPAPAPKPAPKPASKCQACVDHFCPNSKCTHVIFPLHWPCWYRLPPLSRSNP